MINKGNKLEKEVKRSKNHTMVKKGKKNFYFSVCRHIKTYGKLPDLGISKQALQYYVNNLKRAGIITKLDYGVWSIDEDKWQQFLFRKEVKITPKVGQPTDLEKLITKHKIRGHGFVFTLKLPNIRNWTNREQYLLKHKIHYKNIGLYKKTQSILFRQHKIWLSKNSIVIYFPKDKSYFDATAKESKQYAIYQLKQLIIGIERLLSINLRIHNKYEFRVSRQHFANINNTLAEQYNKAGKKLNIYNSKGLWFVIDNSFKLNEAETVNPKTSDKDMDKVVMPFFNDLKDHYDKTGESLTIGKILEAINGLVKLNVQRELQDFNNLNKLNKEDKLKPEYFG